jgi:hypothetical protein
MPDDCSASSPGLCNRAIGVSRSSARHTDNFTTRRTPAAFAASITFSSCLASSTPVAASKNTASASSSAGRNVPGCDRSTVAASWPESAA